MTLPNLLSISRLVIAPGLLYLAWTDQPTLFLLFFSISMLSDIADGYFARKLDQVSELGAQLDSWGDFVTYLTVPVCLWWLWPVVIQPQAVSIVIIVVSYTLTTGIGFLRYGRLASYHTWGGKVSTALLGVAALFLFSGISAWPLRFATAVVVLADIEEIAMMAVLPQWHSDLPSLWHAIRSRRYP